MATDDFINTRQILDIVAQTSGLGTLSSNYAELLSGFNHRSIASIVPINTENSGITFFTRPNLNLSGDNLAQERLLTPLLTNNVMTYQRVIRAMLDPVGNVFDQTHTRKITTPLFDEKQAFMPLLTNGLKSLTGWPDIAMDTFTSKEGLLRENWAMADGTHKTYTVFDLNATFRNYGGDPISLLLTVWLVYMSSIHREAMVPYLKSIVLNRVDYQTRIYRFTLDPSRTRIQKWASAMGCFPTGVPIGSAINFSDQDPYTSDNATDVSTSFKAQGAEYMDPIILNEFNETVTLFNPGMDEDLRAGTYQKIPYEFLKLFNYQGYPYINILTNELEWWVAKDLYTQRQTNVAGLKPAQPTASQTPTP